MNVGMEVVTALLVGCAVLMVLERRGLQTTLALRVKGDIKRESRWFAQYGQFACTLVAGLLVWRIDPRPWAGGAAFGLLLTVMATSFLCFAIKRSVSRVRPGRPNPGAFLGPHWTHANFRESFPSSHSACAASLSAVLSTIYPHAAPVFWMLALICAVLRYLLDAHWPSDVLGGIAIGYAIAIGAVRLFNIHS